jgi:hypothetical protein
VPRGGAEAAGDRPVFSRLAQALDQGLNNIRGVKQAGNVVGDFINATAGAPGRLGWWHKSVGTMYHLAQRATDRAAGGR